MSNIDIFRNGITGDLGTRLKNVKNEQITSDKLIIYKNNNEIQSISISSTGQQILNSVSLDELKTLILQQTQEALVYSNTDGQREINFHIKNADGDDIDSSNLRLQIKNDRVNCNVVIYTDQEVGDKIILQNATKIHTTPGQLHIYTPDLQTLIWAGGAPTLQLTNLASSISSRLVVGTNASSFGKFSVKTDGGAIFNSLGGWDNNYLVVGEVDTANGQGIGLGLGVNTTSNYCVIMANSPTNAWRPLHLTASSIEFNHNGQNRMYIRGNVVVSTNILPSVNSTYNIGNDSNPGGGAGSGTAQWFNNGFFNNVYAGNLLITSDKTLKQNITDLKYGLDYIKQLKPKQYQYINNTNGREHWGFLAQDIRELNKNDKLSVWGLRPNGKQQLNYTEFIAVICKAIQQLDKKVTQPIINIEGENLDLSTIYKRLDDLEDKEKSVIIEDDPIYTQILQRLDILEEKINNKDISDDDEIESDGHFSIMDDLQAKNFQLEQRISKLEKQNKKLTTALNKILKTGVN